MLRSAVEYICHLKYWNLLNGGGKEKGGFLKGTKNPTLGHNGVSAQGTFISAPFGHFDTDHININKD